MKCTKCGYTSFDFVNSCKNCGNELRDLKNQLQIIAVSPEEKAHAVSTESAFAQSYSARRAAPERQFASAAEPPSTQESYATARDAEGLFDGLDFDESFGDIVERTSYEDQEAKYNGEAAKSREQAIERPDNDFEDLFSSSK